VLLQRTPKLERGFKISSIGRAEDNPRGEEASKAWSRKAMLITQKGDCALEKGGNLRRGKRKN